MKLRALPFVLVALLAASAAAVAQQYRWVDKDGRVQYSDAPPPGAKDVRRTQSAAPTAAAASTLPFAVQRLQADFPVTLYSSTNCAEPCTQARGVLNRRGIPFEEVVVRDPATSDRLKAAAGTIEVPTVTVGRQVQRGFEQSALDALLDAAGYPRAGILPPRAQGAPKDPAAKPAPAAAAVEAPKLGPYDPSKLQGPAAKPGQYTLPGDAAK